MSNKIFITNNLERLLEEVLIEINSKNTLVIKKDDFKIEDAQQLINSAYIATDKTRFIVSCCKSYNQISQNALLKILEETPRNINIYLIAPSKGIFLPTIRSRLSIKRVIYDKENTQIDFDFEKIDLRAIYEFTKEHKFIDKELAKEYLVKGFEFYKTLKKRSSIQTNKDLDFFYESFTLLNLNTISVNVITTLMLMILERKSGN